MSTQFAKAGSQRWLQVAVARRPQLLDQALEVAGVLNDGETMSWKSPLAPTFKEYRDGAALRELGIGKLSVRSLQEFWPRRGPVWDALGVSSQGKLVLVEAKAHIPEVASPATQAEGKSLELIEAALREARAHYAPKAKALWSGPLYQYANRLAFQYFLSVVNQLPSNLVFLDFYGAMDVSGPVTIEEWKGATQLLHSLLGLPADLRRHRVFHAYLDARQLANAI